MGNRGEITAISGVTNPPRWRFQICFIFWNNSTYRGYCFIIPLITYVFSPSCSHVSFGEFPLPKNGRNFCSLFKGYLQSTSRDKPRQSLDWHNDPAPWHLVRLASVTTRWKHDHRFGGYPPILVAFFKIRENQRKLISRKIQGWWNIIPCWLALWSDHFILVWFALLIWAVRIAMSKWAMDIHFPF